MIISTSTSSIASLYQLVFSAFISQSISTHFAITDRSNFMDPPTSIFVPNSVVPMSADDVTQLSIISESIHWDVKSFIVEMSVYGAYFILCVLALRTLLKRSKKTRRTWLLLAALIVTFGLATMNCATHLARLNAKFQMILIDNTNLPFLNRIRAYETLPWVKPSTWVEFIVMCGGDSGMMFMINDVLAIWRAVSIWRSDKAPFMSWVMYVLLACTFVIWIPTIILSYLEIIHGLTSQSQNIAALVITCSALSITVNAIATSLIGYTAYCHHIIESKGRIRFSAAKVLVLLTESGVLYFIIQVVRLVLSSTITPTTPLDHPLSQTYRIFTSLTLIMTAMYTPALILIINYGYSIADSVQIDTCTAVSGSGQERKSPRRATGSVSNIMFAQIQATATRNGSSESCVDSESFDTMGVDADAMSNNEMYIHRMDSRLVKDGELEKCEV